MWSAVAGRIAGFKQAVAAAKKVAPEMVEIYGEGVWQRLKDLESTAWREGKITEVFYWRLVKEYVRELKKTG
jgi:hypothetical protein